MNRAIFFDRDGVINELVARNGGYYSPQEYKDFKIKKNIAEIIKKLKHEGFLIVVISNQPDISRGKLSLSELKKMTKKLNDELIIDDIFYCMHDDSDDCMCRKPKSGMILELARKWNIDLKNSFLIGDTWRDVEAARDANVKYFLLDNNTNVDQKYENKVRDINKIFSLIKG